MQGQNLIDDDEAHFPAEDNTLEATFSRLRHGATRDGKKGNMVRSESMGFSGEVWEEWFAC
jgi:hypothetical protein